MSDSSQKSDKSSTPSKNENPERPQPHFDPFNEMFAFTMPDRGFGGADFGPRGTEEELFNITSEHISFILERMRAYEDDRPPLQFVNDKYNVALKVSHTQYEDTYESFQQALKGIGFSQGSSILNDISTKKPAAVHIEIDMGTAFAINPQLVLQALMTQEEEQENITLTDAANFVSDNGENVLMPHCQLVKAIHHHHLFNATTNELLSIDELRDFEQKFKEDLQKQPLTKNGLFYVRSTPQ